MLHPAGSGCPVCHEDALAQAREWETGATRRVVPGGVAPVPRIRRPFPATRSTWRSPTERWVSPDDDPAMAASRHLREGGAAQGRRREGRNNGEAGREAHRRPRVVPGPGTCDQNRCRPVTRQPDGGPPRVAPGASEWRERVTDLRGRDGQGAPTLFAGRLPVGVASMSCLPLAFPRRRARPGSGALTRRRRRAAGREGVDTARSRNG